MKVLAELIGTAFLLMIVVGSGIMGESLSSGNAAIALLANSVATGAGLYVLIQCLGPISGAHMNPIVSGLAYLKREMKFIELLQYWAAQVAGAVVGVFITHVMFQLAILQVSEKNRMAPHLWLSEMVATLGLLGSIHFSQKSKSTASSVALYITAAYWFTSSTSFANPAVTIARSLTNTFCGIAPLGIVPFIVAQSIGLFFFYFLLEKSKAKKFYCL